MDNELWIIGDTHGNHQDIKHEITSKNIVNSDLIHVGDFGIGFTTKDNDIKILNVFNDFLKENNNTLHVFRGNHDNPDFFKGDYILSNIKLHPDYTTLELSGKKILGIGGAISIDRRYRKKNNTGYWLDEKFTLDYDKVEVISDVDILITHTTIKEAYPINKPGEWPYIVEGFAMGDPTLYHDLTEERELVSLVFDKLKEKNNITHHFYGHFHQSHNMIINECNHKCLGIGEFFNLKF